MKRVKIKLKELKPNPYKKDIQGGYIDPITVAQIMESATKTSFWEQWVVREAKYGYELAFGHHRLAAAIELYGPKYEVSVQVEDYTDEQMLIALADENAGREESVESQVDVIRVARTYLKRHPEACKFNPARQSSRVNRTHAQSEADVKKAMKEHEHGSERCLLAFLGKDNWNEQKIHSLVSIADRFDTSLLKDITCANSEDYPERRGAIGITAATEIAKLEKPAQRLVIEAIKEANKDLEEFQEDELEERKKNSIPAKALREMSTVIPATLVRAAVKEAESLPKEKQAQEVVKRIRQEVENRKEYAQVTSLPSAESVVSKIVAQLYSVPDDRNMQTLLGNRELLDVRTKTNLLKALRTSQQRLAEYEERLISPPQKKLA